MEENLPQYLLFARKQHNIWEKNLTEFHIFFCACFIIDKNQIHWLCYVYTHRQFSQLIACGYISLFEICLDFEMKENAIIGESAWCRYLPDGLILQCTEHLGHCEASMRYNDTVSHTAKTPSTKHAIKWFIT